MKNTDWAIGSALRKAPRRRPSAVADEVKISTRTVKRRLTLMTKNNSIFMLPEINYDKSIGVASDYLIVCPDDKKKSEVDKLLRGKLERVIFSLTDVKGFSIFALMCTTVSQSEHLTTWMKRLEGVTAARCYFFLENI